MGMKGRPADRTNNVRTTKTNIERTEQNIEFANEFMVETGNENLKKELAAKNKRREQSLEGLYQEVKDKAKHHKP